MTKYQKNGLAEQTCMHLLMMHLIIRKYNKVEGQGRLLYSGALTLRPGEHVAVCDLFLAAESHV
jgi:hypothetical protein